MGSGRLVVNWLEPRTPTTTAADTSGGSSSTATSQTRSLSACYDPPINAAMSSRITPMIPARFAPFIQFCPLNCYEWFKLLLLLPFAIVRILLLVLLLLFWACCCTIGLCCVGEIAAGEPLPEGRRDCLGAVSRCLAAAAMLLMGCWVTVEGRVPQDRPPIAVFNHVSWLDALIMLRYCSPCTPVAQAFIGGIPIVGMVARAHQTMWVGKRAQPGAEPPKSTAAQISDRAADGRFPMVCLAPEGTTSSGLQLIQFKTGAFLSGHPVLPLVLKYKWTRVSPAWTAQTSDLFHFLRIMTQFINFAHLKVLPPYQPSAEEVASPQLFAQNVRTLMAQQLGVPEGLGAGSGRDDCYRLVRHRVVVSCDGTQLIGAIPPVLQPAVEAATTEQFNKCATVSRKLETSKELLEVVLAVAAQTFLEDEAGMHTAISEKPEVLNWTLGECFEWMIEAIPEWVDQTPTADEVCQEPNPLRTDVEKFEPEHEVEPLSPKPVQISVGIETNG